MPDAKVPIQPTKFVPPPEWRERCELIRLNSENKAEFVPLHPDLIKSLLTAESIDFTIYFAVGWDLFEFIRPREFKVELVKELIQTHKQYPSQTRICLRRSDLGRYEKLTNKYRRDKFMAQAASSALAFEVPFRLYAELSSASQIVIRGSLDQECFARVAKAASAVVMGMCSTKDAVRFLVEVVGKEPNLYDHGAVTAMISACITWNALKSQKRESKLTVQAALLHDVERHCAYLAKPADPTQISAQTVKEMLALKQAGVGFHDTTLEVMQQYRERFDGTGVPRGLIGAAETGESLAGISKMARVVTIGCAFSEYMLKRQEKLPLTLKTILTLLSERAANGEFDKSLVNEFFSDLATGVQRKPNDGLQRSQDEEE